MNLARGLNHLSIVVSAWPSASSRHILRDAWRLSRALPCWFAALALPDLMRRLDDETKAQTWAMNADDITRLTDATVMLDYFSPLGLCLRRSLVRYVLLRRAGVPVVVHFGAKKNMRDRQSKIAGHAWLMLKGEPFAEKPKDYNGFTAIYTYPANPKPVLSEVEGSQIPNPNEPTNQLFNFHPPISNL